MLVIFITNLKAQVNLVPNPSFEDTVHCPFMLAQIYFASHWSGSNGGTSDYFNSCADLNTSVSIPLNAGGNQLTRSGSGYAGIATYYVGADVREYLQTKLDSVLLPSHKYCAKFFVSLLDTQKVACNNIGMYFSDTAIHSTNQLVFNVIPQINNDIVSNPLTDKTGWTMVSGSFIANGGEQYITIGNFVDDANSDTVHVAGGCCAGSGYYIDDVSVVDCTYDGIDEITGDKMHFKLYPNPNNGNMVLEYKIGDNETGEIEIYDLAGKLISSHVFNSSSTTLLVNENNLDAGAYYYCIKVNGNKVKTDLSLIHI